MSDVKMLSVSPTRAVPEIAGLPVAGLISSGSSCWVTSPATDHYASTDRFLLSPVQKAHWPEQLVVTGSTTFSPASESAVNWIRQWSLPYLLTRPALVTSPSLTRKTWLPRVL